MKTIENVTIYKCDFCRKELKRKHAMVNHENRCFNNPENYRICFNGCIHLESKNDGKEEIHYISGGDDAIRYVNTPNYFFCNKKKIKIYTPQAEFRGLLEEYPETFEYQEPMPKECKSFASEREKYLK